ncbi:MAG: hypothetical protein U0325_29365 [Polyangiales bacterium]
MRRAARALALLAGLSFSAPARGDEADELRALADEVLRGADEALRAARAPVFPSEDTVALQVEGDVPAGLSAALTGALREALATRAERVTDDPAAAQRVLRVTLARATTTLTARTSAQQLRAGAWDRFLRDPPRAAPAEGRAVDLSLSASLRARFGMPSRPPWPASGTVRTRTIQTPFREVPALALGRLGAVPALALATADTLRVARFDARTLAFLPQTWALSAVGVVAAPPREPLGSMTWDAQGLRVRTSAQPQGAVLAAEGEGLARALRPAGDVWPTSAGDLRADPVRATVSSPLDPAMRAAFPAARGSVRVDCDGLGGCVVRVDGAVRATLQNVAPPALVDDLDEDGAVEVVLASASQPDATDRARVFTLRDGALSERASVPTPGPVLALAAGETPEGRALVIAARDLTRGTVTLLLGP